MFMKSLLKYLKNDINYLLKRYPELLLTIEEDKRGWVIKII
jgi:hypothetical protein